MNKIALFCIGSMIAQAGFARYPGMRIVRDQDAKTITIVNASDEKIFARFKPTYVHATCESCNEQLNAHEDVHDCCSKIKTVEYAIPPQTTQRILLDKIRVASPDNEDEYLDFTKIVYAKIYDHNHKRYQYVSIKNNTTYVISSIEKKIISKE